MAELLVGGAKLLARPLEDLYQLGKDNAVLRLAKFRNARQINALYKKIDAIQKVKTIWQIDKEVRLMRFYYPSKVAVGNNSRVVSNIGELSPEGNCVIQGTVGQGKSIFLRFLCIKELSAGKRVPIFFELRRIERGQSFRDYLYSVFKTFDIEIDDALFDFYASSGKIVLLLDGFDELDPQLVTGVINEIELLAQQYPRLQMIITSRENSGIERSVNFRVCKLSGLKPDDHKPFLEKIDPEKARVRGVLRALERSPTQIKSLLTTPLMLTLLVIVYKSEQTIPSTLPEFYENLFHTLLTRHDATKPGFSRKKFTKLSDDDLKQLFENFCFVAKQRGLLVLTREQMTECLNLAVKATGYKCDAGGFCQDITKVVCLMQEEAFRYHFIHKSILEFNAASFIRHSNDDLALKFYSSMADRKWGSWEEELKFLSAIDSYRYSKYLLVPEILRIFREFNVEPNEHSINIAPQVIMNFLNTMNIELSGTGVAGEKIDVHSLHFKSMSYVQNQFQHNLIHVCFQLSVAKVGQVSDQTEYFKTLPKGEMGGQLIAPVGDWISRLGNLEKMSKKFEVVLMDLAKQLREAQRVIDLEESKIDLLSI